MLKKIAGIRQKLKMRLNIVNTIWKQFFAFSKFTAEENKERCNLDDAEGLLMFTIWIGQDKPNLYLVFFSSKDRLKGRWYYGLYSTIY